MKKIIRLTESDLYRIVKKVLKEEETDEYTPTGEPFSDGKGLTLEPNNSIGILDDGDYLLKNTDAVFKNYNTTKIIPNGVDYYLQLSKYVDGFDTLINHSGFLTIKNQKLSDNTWSDLFSKFNKVSYKTPNDLLSDEDDIFQSLLDGTVPCFEIDGNESNTINYNIETGTVISFTLNLKSKCDEKINSVSLILDSDDGVYAEVTPSSGAVYTANVVWDGNDLSFPKSKSGSSELIIKV
jgi:hypothetical protein